MKQRLPVNTHPSQDYNPPPQIAATNPNPLLQAGPANIFLPLRIFLGISFLAAGLDKLFDPQFFDPTAGGYIGNQLAGFAGQSPLGVFLTNIAVPQAAIFGALVLVGELAIGLGTLLGLFSRTAAFFGFVLSILLWLTASWEVTPFFLGSDLPYAMGWLTLFLAGPHPVLSLDAKLRNKAGGFATAVAAPASIQNYPYPDGKAVVSKGPSAQALAAASEAKAQLARRQFLRVAGGTILAGAFTTVAWAHTLHENEPAPNSQLTLPSTPDPATAPSTTQVTSVPGSQVTQAPASTSANSSNGVTTQAGYSGSVTTRAGLNSTPTPAPATPQQPAIKGPVIGKLSAIPVGSAVTFTTPGSGESAYLVHEKDGSVKAFSSICTHEGCEVSFSQSNQIFVCPCHGAQFDAKTGAVLRRPARQPLQSFSVQVDGSGNIIYTAGT